jgi:hypothetical protein
MAVSYELLEAKATKVTEHVMDGSPKVVFDVMVKTGIVGDPYGFVKFDQINTICPKSMTGDEMDAQIQADAQAFVAANYINV